MVHTFVRVDLLPLRALPRIVHAYIKWYAVTICIYGAHLCACRSGTAARATLNGAHPCARMHLLIRRPPVHVKFRGVGYRRESRHLTAIILIVIIVEWAEKAGGGAGEGGWRGEGAGEGGGGGGAAAIRQNTSLHCPSSECTGIYLPFPPLLLTK